MTPEELTSENERLRSENAALKQRLAELEGLVKALQAQLASAMRAIAQSVERPGSRAVDQPAPALQAGPQQGTWVSMAPPAQQTPAMSPEQKASPLTLLAVGAIVLALCIVLGGLGAFAASKFIFPAASASAVRSPTVAARPTVAATSPMATAVVPTTRAATAEVAVPPTQAPTPKPTANATEKFTQEPSPTPSPQPTALPLPVGMVLAPAGKFNMGSTAFADTQPVHAVTLDAFYIDQFEVVNDLYHQCVAAGGCTDPGRRSSDTRSKYYDDPAFGGFPVISVTWQQAGDFCKWQDKRLPTEPEWEYAATGGTGRAYPWGDNFDSSLVPATAQDTQAVDSIPKNASPFGAEDMAGNVSEWVADWYAADSYASSLATNPTGPATGTRKVIRGGAYGNSDPTIYLAARRFSHSPNASDVDIGFRCAMPAPH